MSSTKFRARMKFYHADVSKYQQTEFEQLGYIYRSSLAIAFVFEKANKRSKLMYETMDTNR